MSKAKPLKSEEKLELNKDTKNSLIYKNFSKVCEICEEIAKSLINDESNQFNFKSLTDEQKSFILLGIRHGISSSAYAFDKLLVKDGKLNVRNFDIISKLEKPQKKKS